MAHIISVEDGSIHVGEFIADSVVVGSTREECLEVLRRTHCFAEEIGPSTREDAYVDEFGEIQVLTVQLYTMRGGSIR